MYFEIPGSRVRVLGSLHLFPAHRPALPGWAADAAAWSEAVVHEHDTAALQPRMRADAPLHSVVRPRTWATVAAAFPDAAARAALDACRPWAAFVAAISALQHAVPGVEARLLADARAAGKPLQALESPDELQRGLDAIPLAEVEAALRRSLRDPARLRRRFEDMHAAWLARDRDALLQAASATPMMRRAALREAALLRRNRTWAPRIRALLPAARRTLVVVGALHLCGPGSLEECLGVELQAV